MRPVAGRGPNLNWRLVVPVVCAGLAAVTLGFVVCLAYAVLADDNRGTSGFAVGIAVSLPLSVLGLLGAPRLRRVPLRARDGFLAVTLTWVVAAVVGTIPIAMESSLPRIVDAFFESMSGISTTGATLIDVVEDEPGSILLWRSISHWIGGIGIVVLVVAIAPAVGLAQGKVFFAETSGMSSGRLTPRIAETAKIITGIYLVLTTLATVGFLAAGLGAFDAVNHALSASGTGGFSTRTASIAAFDSLAVELVAIVVMVAAGINFAFYWRAMRGGGLMPQGSEVGAYLLILLGATLAIAVSLQLADEGGTFAGHVRDAGFSVASVSTGTGFTTADFDGWNDFARTIVLLLMFIGGCAGSTAGGMKVIRVVLLAKIAGQEVTRQLRPKAVLVLRTRGQVFGPEVRANVLAYFFVYVALCLAGTLGMLASGLDLTSSVASVAATVNVVGPGLGQVGALDNYQAVSDGGLVVLSALMLIGRLEIFTVLVLLTPAFWRPNVA